MLRLRMTREESLKIKDKLEFRGVLGSNCMGVT